MSASFKIDGLEQLLAELRALPDTLTVEGGHIVEGEGNGAFVDIRGRYQQAKGDLSQYVTIASQQSGRFGAAVRLKVNSGLAHIFENGTMLRHTAAGVSRGAIQPPQHVFIPAMIKARKRMYVLLADLLRRHGLQADGDASL